jgi:hypothetical protein
MMRNKSDHRYVVIGDEGSSGPGSVQNEGLIVVVHCECC